MTPLFHLSATRRLRRHTLLRAMPPCHGFTLLMPCRRLRAPPFLLFATLSAATPPLLLLPRAIYALLMPFASRHAYRRAATRSAMPLLFFFF